MKCHPDFIRQHCIYNVAWPARGLRFRVWGSGFRGEGAGPPMWSSWALSEMFKGLLKPISQAECVFSSLEILRRRCLKQDSHRGFQCTVVVDMTGLNLSFMDRHALTLCPGGFSWCLCVGPLRPQSPNKHLNKTNKHLKMSRGLHNYEGCIPQQFAILR